MAKYITWIDGFPCLPIVLEGMTGRRFCDLQEIRELKYHNELLSELKELFSR